MEPPDKPAGRTEVQLNPAVQAMLLTQMREEQAARIRARQIRNYVVFPLIGLVTVVGTVMAFSDDQTEAMIGNLLASSILWVVWKLRKRISAALGF